MVESMIIRRAVPADVDSLVAIEEACFDRPWSRESLARDLGENPLAQVYCAETRDRVVGYVDVWVIEEEGHINNVAVLPEYRRKHVAAVLLYSMIRGTESAGVQSHTLEVARNNAAAIALYRKFGFAVTGVRPGYYENGEDALIMWRLGDLSERGAES